MRCIKITTAMFNLLNINEFYFQGYSVEYTFSVQICPFLNLIILNIPEYS